MSSLLPGEYLRMLPPHYFCENYLYKSLQRKKKSTVPLEANSKNVGHAYAVSPNSLTGRPFFLLSYHKECELSREGNIRVCFWRSHVRLQLQLKRHHVHLAIPGPKIRSWVQYYVLSSSISGSPCCPTFVTLSHTPLCLPGPPQVLQKCLWPYTRWNTNKRIVPT